MVDYSVVYGDGRGNGDGYSHGTYLGDWFREPFIQADLNGDGWGTCGFTGYQDGDGRLSSDGDDFGDG